MTISETDLRLLKSERMTDFSDGGGKMTGVEVVDGLVNNLFNDISQLDRTYGRVSLRKEYAVVQTANTDTYLGAHIILTDPPDDPNVNVTLFTTGSWTDERDASRNRIESYSLEGPEAKWILYGDHVIGQKVLQLFSLSNTLNITTPSNEASTEIGDVMVLSVEKAGYTAVQQYVRIIKIINRETQQFTDATGNFFKDVLTLEISNPLRYLFPGATPTRITQSRNAADSSPTMFRTTSVADAAEYYGVKKITQALSISDLTINVGSPYSALVPSAQAETPLVDINASMLRPNLAPAGTVPLVAAATIAGSIAPDYAARLYLGRGFMPGSLVLTIAGTAYKDDSNGKLTLSNGTAGTYGGTVDYASGAIIITKLTSWSAAVSATATPAVAVYNNAGTKSIEITVNNRSFNYVQTLQPKPSPGSLIVDFKALNKWYRLSDDGLGHLSGNVSGIGVGTVNYATGSVIVTLAALPDVDSSVIFAWTTPLDYTLQTYVASPPKPEVHVTLANLPVTPGSLSIAWTDGGAKTATANAAGVISGDATGRLVHSNGKMTFRPNNIPTSGTSFTITYSQLLDKTDVFSVTGDGSGNVSFTLTQTPVRAGSVRLAYNVNRTQPLLFGGVGPEPVATALELFDDGAGGFKTAAGVAVSGTINYSTGAVTVDSTGSYNLLYAIGFSNASDTSPSFVSGPGWKPVWTVGAFSDTLAASTTLIAHYSLDTDTPDSKSESVSLTQLAVDLSTTTAEALVAGSLLFNFAGETFFDRNGLVYRTHSPTTDAGTESGSIDYQSGIATLTGWNGGSSTLTILAAVSLKGQNLVSGLAGRAPGAPLATGQFQLNFTAFDGTNISVSADNNGDMEQEWVKGHVDWLSGVFVIYFGKSVADSSLSAAIKADSGWYDAAKIVAGNIWMPYLVKPETITFNAVLVSYIPLDADILGVETVRLPQDGRVPIYRVGNVAVVHNTLTFNLTNPVTAGATYTCSRTLLSYAKLFDTNGLVVPTSKYTTDLDAGTVTMSDPLDLTGYVQPLKCEHRIEDMALVTDVQITGQVQLMKPVRHAYPANTSFLSSALVIGDMQARVTDLFDQQTWANVFSDTLSGSAASASFNDVLYPLVVTNAGAIQERWALVFTGSTAFNCYGEYSGLIAQHTTGTEFAPVNPITSVPYFILNYLGWGTGWSAGNVLRFNTIGANVPLWLARTTLQSDPAVYTDNFKMQIRGDAN